ncbi:hypothetical protein DQ04_05881040, partial [Trypanosoma grayi]|uniref:hypothetical protein n=1 Tax=Trypanosoma grayi TaxID=71804 RepID=UPI0004F48CDB
PGASRRGAPAWDGLRRHLRRSAVVPAHVCRALSSLLWWVPHVWVWGSRRSRRKLQRTRCLHCADADVVTRASVFSACALALCVCMIFFGVEPQCCCCCYHAI